MLDRLRRMVRSTPGDSRHRGRRREEDRGDNIESNRGGTIGATRGGTMGRTRGGTMGQNREQASCVGHIGRNEYQYRGPAPSDSHTQSIFSPGRSWNVFRSRHPRHPDPTPPHDYGSPTSRDSSLPRYFCPPPYGAP
ncbi:hypothetical protein BPAE_0098g00040 [Botrytis paeoniae]|uniref:Uncharacterized protein n=1 Tax=Botrytis paeoniae TaxID=278948 RepID=A0A4Z1FJI3_9HELO|nr:hypothetical protein BPAE_0098g00040 [Botrytis paeoniae]